MIGIVNETQINRTGQGRLKVLLVIFAFAAIHHGLTLWAYADVALWWDEAHTYWMVKDGFGTVAAKCASEVYPPLYFWIMSGWTSQFGYEEWALRTPSVIFATLTIFPIYFAARTAAGFRAAAIAALVAACVPLLNFYAVEARAYGLLIFLISTAMCFYIQFLASPKRTRALVGFTISIGAALYSHHYVVFLLPALVLGAFVFNSEKRLRLAIAILIAELIAFIPYTPWFLVALGSQSGTEWIALYWTGWTPVLAIMQSIEVFGFGGVYPRYLWHMGPSNRIPFIGIVVTCAVIVNLLIDNHRNNGRKVLDPTPDFAMVLLSAMLIPLFCAWAYSWLRSPIYLVGRYDVISLPAFILILSIGVARLIELRPRSCGYWLVGLIIGVGLWTSTSMIIHANKANWRNFDRECAMEVNRIAQPNDLLVCIAMRRIVTEYYLDRIAPNKLELISYPPKMNQHPGIYYDPSYLKSDSPALSDALIIKMEINKKLADGAQVFIAHWQYPGDAVPQVLYQVLVSSVKATPVGNAPEIGLFRLTPSESQENLNTIPSVP